MIDVPKTRSSQPLGYVDGELLSLLIASENQQYLLLRVLGAFLTTKAANTCIAACVGGLRTPAYALQLSWTALLQGIPPSSIS